MSTKTLKFVIPVIVVIAGIAAAAALTAGAGRDRAGPLGAGLRRERRQALFRDSRSRGAIAPRAGRSLLERRRELSAHVRARCARAHAGTVRAAIGAALSQPEQGLAFEVAPLSVTVLRCHGTEVGIVRTNGGLVG